MRRRSGSTRRVSLLMGGARKCAQKVAWVCARVRQKFSRNSLKKHLTFSGGCGIIIKSPGSVCFGAHLGVAQLVARYLGVVEAASSSLVTQTRISLNF